MRFNILYYYALILQQCQPLYNFEHKSAKKFKLEIFKKYYQNYIYQLLTFYSSTRQ